VAIAAAAFELLRQHIGDRAAASYRALGRREVVRDRMTTPNPETM